MRARPQPSQSAVTLSLPDGSLVEARPVRPDDKHLFVAGFDRLSERSRYLRFQSGTEALDERRLRYLTDVDHLDHVAWGILDGDEPVAVGRWIRLDDPTRADAAVTVVDDHQRRGIGTVAVQLLADSARRRNVEILVFEMLAENHGMIRVVERLGGAIAFGGQEAVGTLPVADVPAPPIVDGDPGTALDLAAQSGSGSNSSDSELTQ